MPLESTQPPSHFLVRAGSLEVIAVLSRAPSSGFDLSYYAIVGGGRKIRIEGRIVSMVNGEMIVCIATKQECMERKGDKTQE